MNIRRWFKVRGDAPIGITPFRFSRCWRFALVGGGAAVALVMPFNEARSRSDDETHGYSIDESTIQFEVVQSSGDVVEDDAQRAFWEQFNDVDIYVEGSTTYNFSVYNRVGVEDWHLVCE